MPGIVELITYPQTASPDLIKRYDLIVNDLTRVRGRLDRFYPKRKDYVDSTEHKCACMEHEIKRLELDAIIEYYEKLLVHCNDVQR